MTDTQIQSLTELVVAETRQFEQMLELLDEEQRALIGGNIADIEKFASGKLELLEQIDHSARLRAEALRAFGIDPPKALDRIGALSAEGTATGTAEVFDIANLSLRLGPTRLGGQVHADLSGSNPSVTADLTAKVKAAIFEHPSLKSAEINVETFKGVVQLSGFVNSQADINTAVGLARGVKGVQSVKNDMRLK